MTVPDASALAARAIGGDRAALSELCKVLQGPIYRLSLDMLWHPADAEDAAQEILVKVVTHLSSFEGRSAITTWVYQIAFRHLLRFRAGRAERSVHVEAATDFAALIDAGVRSEPAPSEDAELLVLAREVRIGCVNGMLQCLSRGERAAYVLSEVLGVTDASAAEICEVEPPAYRQRLSRARRTMDEILRDRCGLVSEANPCRCAHQAGVKKALGLSRKPLFARASLDPERNARALSELGVLGRAAPLFRTELVEPRQHLWERLRAACPELLG